jgi:hypothetical protein
MDDTDTRRRQNSHALNPRIRYRAAVARHDLPVGGSRLRSARVGPSRIRSTAHPGNARSTRCSPECAQANADQRLGCDCPSRSAASRPARSSIDQPACTTRRASASYEETAGPAANDGPSTPWLNSAIRRGTGIRTRRPRRSDGISPRLTASYAADRPRPRSRAACSTVMNARPVSSGTARSCAEESMRA